MADLTRFITVHDDIVLRWKQVGVNPELLDELLNDINFRIRGLLMSMAARDIKVVPFEVKLCGDWNEVLHV